MTPPPRSATTAVVLGCRVRESGPSSALERRLRTASKLVGSLGLARVVLSGGKRWGATSEADAMAEWWRSSGAPETELILERASEDTLENAERTRELLEPLGVREIYLVTCDFHMKRATVLFSEQGFSVIEIPAHHQRSWFERRKLAFQEWGALRLLRQKWKKS